MNSHELLSSKWRASSEEEINNALIKHSQEWLSSIEQSSEEEINNTLIMHSYEWLSSQGEQAITCLYGINETDK